VAIIDPNYSLVLRLRLPGMDRQVAQALSQLFGRDEPWGLQIVGATPIIMLDGLTVEQAQMIREVLSEVEQAGGKFEIQRGESDDLNKISWPMPPRIRGRTIAELVQGSTKTSATLTIPCPYTGRKIRLIINVQVERLEGESAQASAAPMLQQLKVVPVQAMPPEPYPTPVAPQQAVRAQSGPIPHTLPGRRTPLPPVAIPPPIVDQEGLEELLPMEQFTAHSPQLQPNSPARGAPVPGRSPSAGVPLPDVPLLHNAQPPQPVPQPASTEAAPPAVVSIPMDLEVFEQHVSSSGMFKAGKTEGEEVEELPAGELEAEPNIAYSVYMGKSTNPKVHHLLAEVQGISIPDAARICQRTLVAVAKNVSAEDASEIKQRFADVNVNVRITKTMA
jgi:hypothetical protein